MANVKTITATTTESIINFEATYQYMWFRNLGETDCYISEHSGIVANADNVTLLKAGEVARLTLPQSPAQSTAYIKAADGSNTVEVHAQNYSDCPFKISGKGGESGSSANIYRTTTALTDGATTNPITADGESVTVVSGDFAVYNTQEFLFDGTQWNLLGDRVGLGEMAYLDKSDMGELAFEDLSDLDLGELAMKNVDDIHSTLSDIEYEALPDAKKNDGTEYFVYETSEDKRSIIAYDSNGDFLYKMSMYGCNNVATLALASKITEPPTITGTDHWGSGSYVFKTTFADGNTYYHNDSFASGGSLYTISNNDSRVADAYGTNLFFAISGNRFTIMSAPDSAWISSLHLDGYNENSFTYGAIDTGNRQIYRNNKVYGKNENHINYSTTEQNTGRKWIDGKPIYQKTFSLNRTFGSGDLNRVISISDTPISNIDTLVDMIWIGDDIGGSRPANPAKLDNSISKWYSKNDACFQVYISSQYDCVLKAITAWYTKTTDTAE